MKNRYLFTFVLILFLNYFAKADDAPIAYLPGGSVKPIENNNIRLVKETIEFTFFESYYLVEVNYLFQNLGKQQPITMGFPNSNSSEYKIKDFKAYENDKELKIFSKSGQWKTSLGLNMMYKLNIFECFKTKFDSGEYKHIKNVYKQGYTYAYRADGIIVSYILSTGSLWKGKIDSITIKVNTNRLNIGLNYNYVKYSFNKVEYVKLNAFKRVYTNIDPKNDFMFTIPKSDYFYPLSATSNLLDSSNSYSYDKIMDNNLNTAWFEGVKGAGIGEQIVIVSDKGEEDSHYAYQVDSIGIYNGYQKSKELYKQNNRVKKLKLTIFNNDHRDSCVVMYYTLKDTDKVQYFKFSPSLKCSKLIFEINDVYKGAKFNDTGISEIKIFHKQTIY